MHKFFLFIFGTFVVQKHIEKTYKIIFIKKNY